MKPGLAIKLRLLLWISLFSCFAGVIFQLIVEDTIDYNSIMIGFPLGLSFGLLELFLFPKIAGRFRQWSFTKTTLVKTLIFTAIIYFITVTLAFIVGVFNNRDPAELITFLTLPAQLVLVLYSLTVYGLLVFILQINQLLGRGILWKFVRGKYHRPHEEERIFMFLDMKSSTTIAERLGHVRFYRLLNELFHEISEPVLFTKAEIYQYVGDEVVLTWEMEHGLKNANCLQFFFMFQKRLVKNENRYFNEYGVKPAFKAGLHFGKVVSAQIGDLKREIVYNGDVLNTTSRIQSECNHYQRSFLVSGSMMDRLKEARGYNWEKLESVTLRGKETEVEIYGVAEG